MSFAEILTTCLFSFKAVMVGFQGMPAELVDYVLDQVSYATVTDRATLVSVLQLGLPRMAGRKLYPSTQKNRSGRSAAGSISRVHEDLQ